MGIRRSAGIVAAIVVASLLLSGCASTGGDGTPDILRVNGSEPANPLTPGDTVEPGGFRILQALYAGLVAYDEFGAAIPDAAQSITPNDDNSVYTVKLRDGETFSDGEPVTADSFVDSWDWIALASNGALNQGYFSDFVGFSADADASLITEGGLVVIDDRTFEIHLTASISDFSQRLGLPVFSPVPPKFFADPSAFAEHPIGNGPYRIDGDDAWKHGNRIELVANPDYHGQREPENDGITMLFYGSVDDAYSDLLSGHLDVLDRLPQSSLATFDEELSNRDVDVPGPALESITIPSTLPHFAETEGVLRRTAISKAFDRTAIIHDLFGVTRAAAQDFATPGLEGFRGQVRGSESLLFSEDVAIDAWGRANLLSPWEGTFEIAYSSDGGDEEWVDAVAASISATLGIDAAGKPYPSEAALQSAIDGRTVGSAYVTQIRADIPTVTAFIGRYASDSPENTELYKNVDFDALLDEGAKATSRSDIEDAYSRAQSILLADLPALPLWNSTMQAGFGEGIEHVTIDWRGVPRYEAITKSGG